MTSVEFLMQEIMGKDFRLTISDNDLNRYQEAVEMHKKEIMNSYRIGACETGLMIVNKTEEYYLETFKNY